MIEKEETNMLGIVYDIHLQVVPIVIVILMVVHGVACWILHKKKEDYFNIYNSVCGYIATVSFFSGFIVGMTFIFSYVLSYQVLNHIVDKIYLFHLIYLVPLFVLSLYLLIKSCFFKMKVEKGYLIIRNAFGITSKYSIHKIRYKRKFGLFTILFTDKKRIKILIQGETWLYNLDHILDILHKHK